MSTTIVRTTVLISALAATACGATTRETAPVTTPPTASSPGTTVSTGPIQAGSSARGVVPVGQELDVRLQSS